DLAADAAAAAWIRGLRARALIGTVGAISDAGRRGGHPRGQPDDAGAVLSPAPSPGTDRQAAPADSDDAEVAAAPAPSDQLDHGPGRDHALSAGAGRARSPRRAGHTAAVVHGQDLLRPRRPPRP